MHRFIFSTAILFGASTLLFDSAVKGTVILSFATIVAYVLRRDSAATRHHIWAVAMIATTLVPMFSVLLPHWRVLPDWVTIKTNKNEVQPEIAKLDPKPSISHSAEFSTREIQSPGMKNYDAVEASTSEPPATFPVFSSEPSSQIEATLESEAQPEISPTLSPERTISFNPWIVAASIAWAVGLGILILRLCAARLMLDSNERRAKRRGLWNGKKQCPDKATTANDPVFQAFIDACRQLKIRQTVRLLTRSGRNIPLVWGMFQFRLMLPESSQSWNSGQLRSVLLHELAHIKRHDTLVQVVSQLACAVHWFNPLVWFANWRLQVERENACDDLVLASGVKASSYALHLLDVATQYSTSRWTSACGLAMASHSPLENRLQAILSGKRNRRKVPLAFGIASLLLAAALVIPIAMLQAAEERDWNLPSTLEIITPTASTLTVHDHQTVQYVIAYRGSFLPNVNHASIRKTKSWSENISLEFVLNNKPAKLILTRDSTFPNRLQIDNKKYDLSDGRVFLLRKSGELRQIATDVSIPQNEESARRLLERLSNGDSLSNSEPISIGSLDEIPKNGMARLLLERWQDLEERKTQLGNATLERLRRTIDEWSKLHPSKSECDAMQGQRDWQLHRAEHPISEVVAWLNRIAEIHPGPLNLTLAKETRVGAKPDSMRLSSVNFGPPSKNGLRAGLSIHPRRHQFQLGEIIRSSLLIQNTSGETVEFTCPHSFEHFSTWSITAQDSSTAKVFIDSKRAPTRDVKWKLRPGETAEISGNYIFVGNQDANTAPGSRFSNRFENVTVGNEFSIHLNLQLPAKMTTGSTKFKIVDANKAAVWSTTRAGKWTLPDGIGIEVSQNLVHASDVSSTAILIWPKNMQGKAFEHKIWLGGDAFANREPWMLAWERGKNTLWTMRGKMQSSWDFHRTIPTPTSISRIDFSNPREITHTTWSYLPEVAPVAIRTEFENYFFPLSEKPLTPNHAEPSTMTSQAKERLVSVSFGPAKQSQNEGVVLKRSTVQELKWGEPNHGLRMALAWPPKLGEPQLGAEEAFYLVVQNVSEKPIRLHSDKSSPNPRKLFFRDGSRILTAFSDKLPTSGDWLLSPHRVAFIPMFTAMDRKFGKNGVGAAIESDVRLKPSFGLTAQMSIEKSLPDAWTGTLKTGRTRGSVDVIPPKDRDADRLFQSWMTTSRADGKIAGACVGNLAESIKLFIKNNPTWETTPRLQKLLPRFDAQRDWVEADAISLLNDLAAIQTTPIRMALDVENIGVIQTGVQLPKELFNAPWGKAAANGLRHAWLLEPQSGNQRLGTALTARVLIHNSGTETIVFRAHTWNQLGHTVKTSKGENVETESTFWTTRARLLIYRLAPGQFVELLGPGIGVGKVNDKEDWQQSRVGTWIKAKAGQDIMIGTTPLRLAEPNRKSEVKKKANWWQEHIADRLSRHMPFPKDPDARLRLLQRVAMEVLGTSVSKEINDSFIADHSENVLPALAKRLSQYSAVRSFEGSLQSATTQFRVLSKDPNAAIKPRIASGPGRYSLGENIRLVVSRKPERDLVMNTGSVIYFPIGEDNIGYDLKLPSGFSTWAAGWIRGESVMWIAQKGLIRKIDFTDPRKILETRYAGDKANAAPIPAEIRIALEKAVNASTLPSSPSSPSATSPSEADEASPPKSGNADDRKIEPESLLGSWKGTSEGKSIRLSFHRPPVESKVFLDLYLGRGTIGMPMSFKVSPDHKSISLISREVEYGTLTQPDRKEKDRLVLMLSKTKGKIELTRDPVKVSDVPRQTEPRQLFELWKKTSTTTGQIPGERIGELETAVRSYVIANPNYHGSMQLPKMFERFDSTRAWKYTEVVSLLDDVAYYATDPIKTLLRTTESPKQTTENPNEKVRLKIRKNGNVTLDRRTITLEQLEEYATKNQSRHYVIDAREDVPYSEVVEIMSMLKKTGVNQVSFLFARVGDGKYRIANQQGTYELDGGRRLSICRPGKQKHWFTVSWKAEGSRPKCWLKTIPATLDNRPGDWAVAWEPGTDVVWWIDHSAIGKMTLADPTHVTIKREGRTNNFSRDFGLPDGVVVEFRRLGFDVGRTKANGLKGVIGGNTGGHEIRSAEFGMWKVNGTVTDEKGNPLAGVSVRVSTNKEWMAVKTDETGNYEASFALPLDLLATWRLIKVEPILEGFCESEISTKGHFNALLFSGEIPQRIQIAAQENFKPGPIPKLAAQDLIASPRGVSPGTPGHADFVMKEK